jgi:hypothetical protein
LQEQEERMIQMQQSQSDTENRLKMANYMARIKSAEIAAKSRMDNQDMANRGKLGVQALANEGKINDKVFDLNNLLMNNNYLIGPTNRGVSLPGMGVQGGGVPQGTNPRMGF